MDIKLLEQIWQNEGPNPMYHRAQKERLKKDWPLLYKWLAKTFGE